MTVLGIIANEINSMGIPYEFMEWTDAVTYPYWVGEYSEVSTFNEDGYKETNIMLTGTTKGTWMELEQARQKIEQRFLHGANYSTNDGAAVIFYANSFPVPTAEADLKRIQVNLNVKEWRDIQ
jgi:hypothetical protein